MNLSTQTVESQFNSSFLVPSYINVNLMWVISVALPYSSHDSSHNTGYYNNIYAKIINNYVTVLLQSISKVVVGVCMGFYYICHN